MKKYLFILLLLSVQNIHAQAPSWAWAKSVIDTNGISLGGSCTDAAGNTYITGYFLSTINFGGVVLTNPNGGAWPWVQMFLAKFNSAGSIVWATTPEGNCYPTGNAICTDANGNIYVTGIFHSYYFPDMLIFGPDTLHSVTQGVDDIFLAKFDSSGNAIWAKSAGGGDADESVGIGIDNRGNISIAGYFYSTNAVFDTSTVFNSVGPSQASAFIAHYDSTGNCKWAKSFGGGNEVRVNGMCMEPGGNSYITGYFRNQNLIFDTDTLTNSLPGYCTYFLTAIDSSGNVKWAKGTTSSASSENNAGVNVCTGPGGNIYVTGYFLSASLNFGSGAITNAGNIDAFIVAYDSSGNAHWTKDIGGASSDDSGWGIATDKNGNVFATGSFYSNVMSVDLIPLTNSSASGSTSDGYVVMLDSTGVASWAKSLGGILTEEGYRIGTDFNGDVYVTGYFSSPFISFDGHTLLNPTTTSNIYIAKLDLLTSGIIQSENINTFDVFPNPSLRNNTVSIRHNFNHTKIQVISSDGKICRENIIDDGSFYPMRLNFPSGVYFILLQDESGSTVRKLLIGE